MAIRGLQLIGREIRALRELVRLPLHPPGVRNIEVFRSHLGLTLDPDVWLEICDALACLPEAVAN